MARSPRPSTTTTPCRVNTILVDAAALQLTMQMDLHDVRGSPTLCWLHPSRTCPPQPHSGHREIFWDSYVTLLMRGLQASCSAPSQAVSEAPAVPTSPVVDKRVTSIVEMPFSPDEPDDQKQTVADAIGPEGSASDGIGARTGPHHEPAKASASGQDAEQQKNMEEQERLEKALNEIMAARAGRFRLHFVCGDFVKQLSGKRSLKGAFDVATVGVMHAHLLRAQHKLGDTLSPGAVVLVEGAQNLVQVRLFCQQFVRNTATLQHTNCAKIVAAT